MRMMIRYQNGLRLEAVLLAASSDRMRVAVETQCDTIELHRVDAGWRTQRGAAIEIEALMAIPGTDPMSENDGLLRPPTPPAAAE